MADETLGPGSVIASRFQLEDLLEEHSGARFWRATDHALARNVAVHVLPADDPRAPLVLEAARRSVTVSDPRLLRVLDAIEEDGWLHVVHEWGTGVSLDRMLEEGPLDPRRAAWLVREAAEVLALGHRHGVAHGRLIPENVLVTDTGAVKLIGFVVDGALHGAAEPGVDDPGGDVRNLAALLYAGLVGKWPGSPASVLPEAPLDHGQVLRPRQVRAGVPKPLDTLCDQVLNGTPGDLAPATAAGIQRVLTRFLGEQLQGADVDDLDRTTVLDRQAVAEALAADPDATRTIALPVRPPAPAGTTAAPAHASADAASPETTAERPAVSSSGVRPPGVGMGAGALPPHWGPDRREDTGPVTAYPSEAEPGFAWMRLGAVLGVLVLIALAATIAFNLGSDRSDDPGTDDGSPTASATEPVEVAAVSDFDPDGEGSGEKPELVPLAVDGDPATAWETNTYFDGPVLAPYRSGLGLLLDLGTEVDVAEVEVTLGGSPYDVALLAAEPGSGAPTTTDGLAEVAARKGAGGKVVLAGQEPVRARYLVVWLTALPATDGGYRGQVAEVVVRS